MTNSINPTQRRKTKMLKCLTKTMGVVTTAAKMANIDATTHYVWLKDDPTYKKKVDDMLNLILDFTESKLYKLIQDDDRQAIFFLLSRKGKERGWGEKIDISGQVNHNIKQLIINVADDETKKLIEKATNMIGDNNDVKLIDKNNNEIEEDKLFE